MALFSISSTHNWQHLAIPFFPHWHPNHPAEFFGWGIKENLINWLMESTIRTKTGLLRHGDLPPSIIIRLLATHNTTTTAIYDPCVKDIQYFIPRWKTEEYLITMELYPSIPGATIPWMYCYSLSVDFRTYFRYMVEGGAPYPLSLNAEDTEPKITGLPSAVTERKTCTHRCSAQGYRSNLGLTLGVSLGCCGIGLGLECCLNVIPIH